ncbi:MAG: glycosyltransferase family 4 protein [Chthoniobacterales bacterium]
MRIVVATAGTPFVRGGAEVLADELLNALRQAGHTADLVTIPFNANDPEEIPDQMLACRLMKLREIHATPVDRLIALKFPAYLIPHPKKVVWLMHQHRAAYDLWNSPFGGMRNSPRGALVRDIIQRGDQQLGSEAQAIFTISQNVTRRLREFSEIESEPLYHPPAHAAEFFCAETVEDYFFFPSRLSPAKRQELVLEALALTQHPVRVKFAGLADSPPYRERLVKRARELKIEKRVEWLDFVSDVEKRELYARALGIVFPPFDEDYGYVTLEGMLAAKAVITCDDSGGPLEFITPGETGLVAQPEPASLAAAMDKLWQDRALAKRCGVEGRRQYERLNLSWSAVVRTLLR